MLLRKVQQVIGQRIRVQLELLNLHSFSRAISMKQAVDDSYDPTNINVLTMGQ
jgi:hypothetical protein